MTATPTAARAERALPPEGTVKGVIFDLDGTLYTARLLGLTITTGLLTELRLLKQLFKVRKIERPKRYESVEAFKQGFATSFADLAGTTPERALDWYETRFMPRFTYAIKKRGKQRDGLAALVRRLKTSNIKVAVVSDFGAVPARLEAIGLSPALFDIAKGAEEYGVMKPTAKPFRAIADMWDIPIESILLVGDRDDHDRKSADLAGAPFIGIAGTKHAGVGFLPWDEVVRAIDAATTQRS